MQAINYEKTTERKQSYKIQSNFHQSLRYDAYYKPMFWGNNKKQKNKTTDKRSATKSAVGCVGSEKGGGHGQMQNKSGDEIRAQAMANVRSARAHIGEETLDKIAAAMTKKQQSAMEQAKRQIQGADVNKVLDELKWMLDQKS